MKLVKDKERKELGFELKIMSTPSVESVIHTSGLPVSKVTSSGVLKPRYISIIYEDDDDDDNNNGSSDDTPVFGSIWITYTPMADNGSSKQSSKHIRHMIRKAQAHNVPYVSRKGIYGITSNYETKFVRSIDVTDIRYVSANVIGTKRLESCFIRDITNSNTTLNDRIVTIGYNHIGVNETLDIIAESAIHRDTIINGIRLLLRKAILSTATTPSASNEDNTNTTKSVKTKINPENMLLRYIRSQHSTYTQIKGDNNVNEEKEVIAFPKFSEMCHRINFNAWEGSNWKNALSKAVSEVIDERKQSKDPDTHHQHWSRTKDFVYWNDITTIVKKLKNQKIDDQLAKDATSNSTSKSPTILANRVWDSVFGSEVETITVQEFVQKFMLNTQQKQEVTSDPPTNDDKSTVWINALQKLDMGTITRAKFEMFLHHPLNGIYDPNAIAMNTTFVLDRPISEYWINSSHNTYLTIDQLYSRSSVEMYTNTLQDGYRCLELDCWDGPMKRVDVTTTDSQILKHVPVVYHGFTITSKISFESIVHVLSNYIDEHPHTYPIILSLEVHCSLPYQDAMAYLMQSILKEKLYIPPSQDNPDTKLQQLPSPEELRGKVVLKGKRPPDADDNDDDDDDDEETKQDPSMVALRASAAKEKAKVNSEIGSGNDTNNNDVKSNISTELGKLILFHIADYSNFNDSLEHPCTHMHNIGETRISKILKTKSDDTTTVVTSNYTMWRKYNTTHMTRIYPAGYRIDSSNYYPLVPWSAGCQILSLNYQSSHATEMLLNKGMFRQNNGCGYVLKPPAIMSSDSSSPSNDNDNDNVVPTIVNEPRTLNNALRLKIRVLSGSCLPKAHGLPYGETIDPYIIVTIHDLKINDKSSNNADTNTTTTTDAAQDNVEALILKNKVKYYTQEYKTKVISNNGFCPIWDESTYTEFIICSPSIAFIQFAVYDSDMITKDDRIADACIPLYHVRSGYRSVQLYDPYTNSTTPQQRLGPFAFASLLVEIVVE